VGSSSVVTSLFSKKLLIKTDWSIVVKEKPTVGSPFFVAFPSVHIPNHTKDVKVREGAGESLAQPGRKQATATKLGIYSTYSQRSSINVLARCSNFCNPFKKIRMLSLQPGLRGSNDLRVGRKWAPFNWFFSSGNRW